MTSHDVIMTSSKIWTVTTADVSIFWAAIVVDMYLIQKSNSKPRYIVFSGVGYPPP